MLAAPVPAPRRRFGIVQDVDVKPHRGVYWLDSHDPDFDAEAEAIRSLHGQSPTLYRHGESAIRTDEKAGMRILERAAPALLARPGHPEKREPEYHRHGTRALAATFLAATGEVVSDLDPTRTSTDFADHIVHVAGHCIDYGRTTRVLDDLTAHWSLAVCAAFAFPNDRRFEPKELRSGQERRAYLTDPTQPYRLVFAPTHGSWSNRVELWFGVLARRFSRRGNFSSPEEFEERLEDFVRDTNERKAHPCRRTYTGEPLARGRPFDWTRRQAQAGRARFGRRPRRYERLMYPPRPYRPKAAQLARDSRNGHLVYQTCWLPIS